MTTAASVSAHYRYRYLMGAMQQNLLATTVRLMCIPEDVARLEDVLTAWKAASARMTSFVASEPGVPDRIAVEEVPAAVRERLEEIGNDRLFRASFSAMPTSFKVVDIDNLVAPQREVNLDYVDEIRKRIPGTGVEDLIEFCVGPRTEPPELRVMQTAINQITVTSKSLDLRFLGGFPKPLTEDDIAVAHSGGQPSEAVSLLVGFGAAPINAWMAGTRVVLGNGFHRVVAMRMEGIRRIPLVMQHVANAELEFPEQYLGLSRAYLLQNPRPVLLKDFFDEALTTELRLKPRRKVVKVGWGSEESVIPD